MRLDFGNWTQRLLSVEHLKLDIDNPRFSYFSKKKMNQTEIIKFLIDRFEVYELAKDIATDGYLLNEEPIVCKEGESYVVLAYIIHSGFISGYQNRYGDNLKPPTNVYHRMTA